MGSGIAHASRTYGPNPGYVADVLTERDQVPVDLVFVEAPPASTVTLSEKIFNPELSREFDQRYQERFGYTDAEQAYNAPNKYTYYSDLYGFTRNGEQSSEAKRQFGEYMLRRLAEFHFDNYTKNDPSARIIWETKERLSSFKVEVERFRFDARYSLSGNVLDVNCYNPYADVQVTLRGQDHEAILSVSRPLTRTATVEAHYYVVNGVAQLIGRKSLTPVLGTSLTLSTFTTPTGSGAVVTPTGQPLRESLYLAGMTYKF